VRYVAPITEAGADAEVLRWARVQSICVSEQRWLVGSRNRTEDLLGTYSFASCVATYLPLVNMLKSDVMALCLLAGVPEEVLTSSRQADPSCGRPEEMAEIALEQVDQYLRHMLGYPDALCGLSEGTIIYLNSVYERNHFKRLLPKRGPVL